MPESSLSGVWHGLYTYPAHYHAAHFTTVFIETGSHLSGSTSEVYAFGARKGEVVLATLTGQHSGSDVTFTKTYEGPDEPNHSVRYDGTLSEDGLEIEGRWFIPGNWSGRFLLIRAGSRPVEDARERFEKAE